MRRPADPSFVTLFLVALGLLGAVPVTGKPMPPETVEQAAAAATLVVVALPVRHELEALPDGETRQVRRFSMWTEYRIGRVLRARGDAPPEGTLVRVRDKTNNCLVYESRATRRGPAFEIVHEHGDPPEVERLDLGGLRRAYLPNSGGPVVLFLDHAPPSKPPATAPELPWRHWGWFVSPSPWTEELERDVLGALGG